MFVYEVWLEGSCLRNSRNADLFYEDPEYAKDDAENEVIDIIQEWKLDDVYDGEIKEEDFEIKIIEV